jgi:hypothetical protein
MVVREERDDSIETYYDIGAIMLLIIIMLIILLTRTKYVFGCSIDCLEPVTEEQKGHNVAKCTVYPVLTDFPEKFYFEISTRSNTVDGIHRIPGHSSRKAHQTTNGDFT